jgi:hypothetical protein
MAMSPSQPGTEMQACKHIEEYPAGNYKQVTCEWEKDYGIKYQVHCHGVAPLIVFYGVVHAVRKKAEQHFPSIE